MANENVKNHMEQGGAQWDIEGALDIESGGYLNANSGGMVNLKSGSIVTVAGTMNVSGTLKIGGTTVSPTGAQLNFLAGVTAGEAQASKAVVLDSNSKIDALDITALKINGTSLSATAAELNKLDDVTATTAQLNFLAGVTAGEAQASKAVVLDSSSKIDTLDITTIKKGGTAISPTAVQLNAAPTRIISYEVEDLEANADIANRPIFYCPAGYKLTISDILLLSQGTVDGVDADNTAIIALSNGDNSIGSKTFNNTVTFPAIATVTDLGTLSTYKAIAAGEVIKLSITCGTSADLPGFVVEVVGILETA